MADDEDAPPRRKSAKDFAGQIADDAWSRLLRTASMVILLPLCTYLINDKLNSLEKSIEDKGDDIKDLQSTVGQIASNQSAGIAQRDAQQQQLNTLQQWLQRMSDRINSLGKH